MLTLNIIGKNFESNLIADNETEVKILIEPPQFANVKKSLEDLGFIDVILEDEDGNLYVIAKKAKKESESVSNTESESDSEPEILPSKPEPKIKKAEIIKNSTGVLISCEAQKYKSPFIRKFLQSLVNSKIKPDVVALINGAVKTAAYNSPTCEYLKNLNASGVKILVSDSCSDRLGITEALGVGDVVDMSEIFEEIFSCERIVNV